MSINQAGRSDRHPVHRISLAIADLQSQWFPHSHDYHLPMHIAHSFDWNHVHSCSQSAELLNALRWRSQTFLMQSSYKLSHIFTDLPPPCSPCLEARELRLDVGARWRWRWLRGHTKALLSGQLIGTVVRPGSDGPREWWVTCARRGVRGRLDHDQVGELGPSLAV